MIGLYLAIVEVVSVVKFLLSSESLFDPTEMDNDGPRRHPLRGRMSARAFGSAARVIAPRTRRV